MCLKNLILLVLKSLKRDKKRSILTILGVMIGIASVITIVSLGEAYKKKTVSNLSRNNSNDIILTAMLVRDESSKIISGENFNLNDKYIIESLPGIKEAKIVDEFESNENNVSFSLFGEEFDFGIKKVNKTAISNIIGRNLSEQDNFNKSRYIVINRSLIRGTFENHNQIIGRIATINGINFEIVGVVDDFDGEYSSINIPKNTYEYYLNKNSVNKKVEIVLDDNTNVENSVLKINDILNKSGSMRFKGNYLIQNSLESIELISTILNSLTIFIGIVAGISLFISAIGVMNMIFTSVSEKSLEIGIKRAIGARRRDIINEFLIEGIIITLMGGCTGYLIGLINANLIGLFMNVKVKPSIFTIILAISISIIVGILSSIVPARKAANKNTVDILY